MHSFIPDPQNVFNASKSKAYIRVLGKYHCHLAIEQPLGDSSLPATTALVKQWFWFFHSWAISVQWEIEVVPSCTGEGPVVVMFASGMWNGWIQHQCVRSSKKNHRNKAGIQKLTQMVHVFHTLALAATTAEIISCSSWDLCIHHHIHSNQIMTFKGNLATAAGPYLGQTLDWGPTQLWPTFICPSYRSQCRKINGHRSAQWNGSQKARPDTFCARSFPTGKNKPQKAAEISS